jgi:hypothetical protein
MVFNNNNGGGYSSNPNINHTANNSSNDLIKNSPLLSPKMRKDIGK